MLTHRNLVFLAAHTGLIVTLAIPACSDGAGPIDAAGHIQAVDTSLMSGTPYDTIATALEVLVTDADHHIATGVAVTWSTPDGGRFSAQTSVTDLTGVARTEWILGPGVGTQRASASAAAATAESASFRATADAFRAVALSLGTGMHHCAIDAQGKIWCWGSNAAGELGDGSMLSSEIPVAVALAQPAVAVVTGYSTFSGGFTCALTSGGDVYCWGAGGYGEVGAGGTPTSVPVPTRVALPAGTYRQLAANDGGVCALSSSGDAYCWGDNHGGRFGNGQKATGHTSLPTPTPTLVAGGFSWQQISLGDDRACAVRQDHTVYCWGANNATIPLGIEADTNVFAPQPVLTSFQMDSVTLSGWHQCGYTTLHQTYCWGSNGLAVPSAPDVLPSPTPIVPEPAFQSVHATFSPTFALGVDGKGYWWGPAINSLDGPALPTLFSGEILLRSIGTSYWDVCGIEQTTNVVRCWGALDHDGTVHLVYAPPAVH
jgi:hypothetical protein